jgi:ribonuclease HII
MESFFNANKIEAGCDEAGRGCLAGPVVAAAVILPHDFEHPFINDSKQLSPKKRQLMVPIIKEAALSYGIGFVDHEEIDKINILRASFKAMHLALDQMELKPESLLIDGNRFDPYLDIEHHCMIKGDGRFKSIAAASILAKEARDEYMLELNATYPQYDWSSNKGYPTKKHKEAVKEFGLSPFHRRSFSQTSQRKLKL